jgi:uncharacterized SAM-binding protein YcdF (DUF218 family)
VKSLIAVVLILGAVAFAALHLSQFLVVDEAEQSDVIVVLAGDHNDVRYWRGLDLLRAGYGRQMILDVPSGNLYGRTFAEHAAGFVSQSAGDNKSLISLCTIEKDSTAQETVNIARCLAKAAPGSRSALLVTSDFHTRRALSIFRSRLRRYRWSVAAASDPSLFGQPWWRHREWAKTCTYEWEKLLWWMLFESWGG